MRTLQSGAASRRDKLPLSPAIPLALACSIAPVASAQGDGELFSKPKLNLYTTIQLDMGYEKNQTADNWFDVMRPTKLPAFEGEFPPDGNFYASVRQTRMGFKGNWQTRCGEVNTWFEYELFGSGSNVGETTFRFRHGWAEFCQLGAGQTWTLFMDSSIFPNVVEKWGPNGIPFFRNVQLRWTPWKDGDSHFAVALERPGATRDESDYDEFIELEGVVGHFRLPDITAQYRQATHWGHFQMAALARRIEWQNSPGSEFDLDGDVTGWGINFSASIEMDYTELNLSATYGEGVQSYMNDAPADIGVVENFDNPRTPLTGEPLPMLGLMAYLDIDWNDHWTTSVGWSGLDINNSDGQLERAYEQGEYASINLLYHPVDSVILGPELIWADREARDDFRSEDWRLQLSFKYKFNMNLVGD
ncbi:DcaP family trimeric outer membrane transporter [Microbulbifer sediminum]|uniref:DcaP family trimeric outer membrane transporter n=1 Tax=Microbulbifer sediminum TaxID=2904250 RepID=UPI001F2CF6B7|nr:DcaP family trimeric outer membrane transporter [Microbulbifer sediminum]